MAHLEPHDHRPRLESPEPRKQLPQAVGLRGGARIAIENKPLLGCKHLEAVSHDAVDQLLGHQVSGRHDRADPLADHRVRRDLPTQDLARAEVDQTEALGEPLGLGPLTRARRSKHDHLMRRQARHLRWG